MSSGEKEGLISVIVPCYNVSKYIEDCVKSIRAQTYTNYEAIFVNDGSTDDTLKKLTALCADKPNFYVIDKPNGGVSSTRNAGLAQAKGEFITFIDSDDMYASDFLEYMHSLIVGNDCEVSVAWWMRVKENAHFESLKPTKRSKEVNIIDDTEMAVCVALTGYTLTFSPVNKMYRHSLLRKIVGYPNVFNEKTLCYEDAEFVIRCMDKTTRLVYTDSEPYYYRIRKNSLIHSKFNEGRLTIFPAMDGIIADFTGKYTEGEKYARAYKSVFAMEMLYRMHKSGFKDSEKISALYEILTENIKYIKECKLHPKWRRWFAGLVPVYFRIIYGKRLNRSVKQQG